MASVIAPTRNLLFRIIQKLQNCREAIFLKRNRMIVAIPDGCNDHHDVIKTVNVQLGIIDILKAIDIDPILTISRSIGQKDPDAAGHVD